MPSLPSKNSKILAIVCSDLHLDHTPPKARSVEKDWYGTMAGYLNQLNDLCIELNNPPIVYAGDVTNKWDQPPEFINFLLEHLPPGYAVPGQHDLRYHKYGEIEKTTYGVLVECGKIKDILPGKPLHLDGLILHGFPWEHPITPCPLPPNSFGLHLAVVHAYIWLWEHKYIGVPKAQKASRLLKQLKGYDASVWGDNHKSFIYKNICNCGSFIRRHIDEITHKPFVGLLTKKGKFEKHYLDISKDLISDPSVIAKEVKEELNLDEFASQIEDMAEKGIDFLYELKQQIKQQDIVSELKNILLKVIARVMEKK